MAKVEIEVNEVKTAVIGGDIDSLLDTLSDEDIREMEEAAIMYEEVYDAEEYNAGETI